MELLHFSEGKDRKFNKYIINAFDIYVFICNIESDK